MNDDIERKLAACNQVLASFTGDTTLAKIDRQWQVSWTNYRGERFARRYMVVERDSPFPSFHRVWGHGGTACSALHALVEWCRGNKPPPISWWRDIMAGDEVALVTEKEVQILQSAGYPE